MPTVWCVQVMVVVRVNEQREIDPAYVQKLQDEIMQLRSLVRTLQGSDGASNNRVDPNGAEPDEDEDDAVASGGGLKAQLVRLIQENTDLKHQKDKMQRELDEMKLYHASAAAAAARHGNNNNNQQSTSALPGAGDGPNVWQAKTQLEQTLRQLKDASDRFFKFEIEEEELKAIHDRLFKSLGGGATAPHAFASPAKSLGASPFPVKPRPRKFDFVFGKSYPAFFFSLG